MENELKKVEKKKKPRQHDALAILENRPRKRVSRAYLKKEQRSRKRLLLIRKIALWSLRVTASKIVATPLIEVFTQNLPW